MIRNELPPLEELADRIARENGLSMEDCPYKSPFWRHQWVLMILAEVEALKIPMSGTMRCTHCKHPIAVSLRVDDPIDQSMIAE